MSRRHAAPLVALALGLAGCAMSPAAPVAAPSLEPAPTSAASSGAAASGAASEVPSVAPSGTPAPSPSPSPSPDASVLDLDVTSCNGGAVLHWSASTHPAFHHYIALRSPEREIEPHYPPIAPAVDWGDAYTTDRFVTSAADASIMPSATRWFYRVVAYDIDGVVIAASPVVDGQLHEVEDLGLVDVAPSDDGGTRLRWDRFDGFSECFSHYRVLYGTSGGASTVLAVVSDRERTELLTDALRAGTTYALRVQAVRTTTLETFVVGETGLTTYAVP
jgi:hypothetical protein